MIIKCAKILQTKQIYVKNNKNVIFKISVDISSILICILINYSDEVFYFYLAGITGTVSIDENGDRNADYSLLDMDPHTGKFQVINLKSVIPESDQ